MAAGMHTNASATEQSMDMPPQTAAVLNSGDLHLLALAAVTHHSNTEAEMPIKSMIAARTTHGRTVSNAQTKKTTSHDGTTSTRIPATPSRRHNPITIAGTNITTAIAKNGARWISIVDPRTRANNATAIKSDLIVNRGNVML